VFDTPMSPTTSGPGLHCRRWLRDDHEFFAATPRKVGFALVGAADFRMVAGLLLRKPLFCLGGLVVIYGWLSRDGAIALR